MLCEATGPGPICDDAGPSEPHQPADPQLSESARLERARKLRDLRRQNFRLQSRAIFLTYSQCPLPKDHVLETLQSLVSVQEYIVAEEHHKDGQSHVHCFLRLSKKLDTINVRFFDLEGLEEINGETQVFHPNIGAARSPRCVIRYCTKEGNYLTNMVIEVGDPWRDALTLAREGNLDKATEVLAWKKTRDWMMCREKILSALQAESTKVGPSPMEVSLHLTLDLDYHPLPVWNRRKALIIYGAAGLGKTQLAKNLIPRYLLLSDLDDLRDFDPKKHDGIIFDDLSIYDQHIDRQVHLVDVCEDRKFKSRYRNAFIPKGTPRIYTTHSVSGPLHLMKVYDEGISRRITCWHIQPDPDGLPLHDPETNPTATGRRLLVEVDPNAPTARASTYNP